MNVPRSQLIKELFQQAAEMSPQERECFLMERCGQDGPMKKEIERLLSCDANVKPRFLQEEPAKPSQRIIPQRIGHFEIIRLIGEGGMGSVFEARQEHPRRTVALKIIRMVMPSESVRRRFEYEVQILGQLKHPGIAQIYEAGTDDESAGAPYFAMEYIHGPSLLAFAKERKLSVSQRLALAAEICDAVHHAHQKGVVHRDLKPANILVESEGGVSQPKVLDFGVARATQSDMQQVTMHTEVGQIVGTLSYMSPEQVLGRPDELDVRSDVYALGVILFELLAERLPYDLRGRSIAEAGRIVRDQEPSRLSSVHSAFRGDIETIVAKALAKEKERRYQSAAALADDIRRFLRDEPIVARPASRAYQIRKFAKRNKVVVVGILAVFTSLVLGIIASRVALVRATKAEALALQQSEESQRSAAKARAINQFLQEMLSSVDPAKSLGKEVTIRQALDDAAARIKSGSLKNQPELEADLRTTIGTTFAALGHYQEAEPHLRIAVEIRRKIFGNTNPDLASSLGNLATVAMSQGHDAQAEPMLREALKMLREVYGERHSEVASAMQSLGSVLRSQGKYDEAEPLCRAALEMRRELLGPAHLDVAQSMNSLALLLQNKNDVAEAEPLFREALAIRRNVLGDTHPQVADSLNNLANLLHLVGNDVEAAELIEEALDMRKKIMGGDHPQVAQSLHNYAWQLNEQKEYAKAERMEREALDIWRKTLPPDHIDLANGNAVLGLILTAKGDYADAEIALRETVRIRDSTLPDGHWQRWSARSALGAALAGQNKFEEAEEMLRDSYEGLRDHPQASTKTKQAALDRLLQLYTMWNKPELAAQLGKDATTK